MTASVLKEGDFVWCAFPKREDPLRPGPNHLAYTLAVSGTVALVPDTTHYGSALLGYTTSRLWPHDGPRPKGVFEFSREQALSLGQRRPFVMDLRRLAFVPISSHWFPYLDQPDHGVQGHAPKDRQRRYRDTAMDLLQRDSDLIDRLGPLWP